MVLSDNYNKLINYNKSSPCCLKPAKSEFDGISDEDIKEMIKVEVTFRKEEMEKREKAGLERNHFHPV